MPTNEVVPPRELTDRGTRNGPAVATNGPLLAMAWRGLNEDNIWVSVSTNGGVTWSPQRILFDRATRNAPALTAIGSKFIMAWQGLFEDTIWISTSPDGLNWSTQQPLTDRGTSQNPALGAAGDLAVMVWRGVGSDNTIWVSTSHDGVIWTPQQPLRDRGTRNGPAVAGALRSRHGGRQQFVMVWRGVFENNLWFSTSPDGLNWSPQRELTDRGTQASPGIAHSAQLDMFLMAWQGSNEPSIWVSNSVDGTTWSAQENLSDCLTQAGPIGLVPTSPPSLSPANLFGMAFVGLFEPAIWVTQLQTTP